MIIDFFRRILKQLTKNERVEIQIVRKDNEGYNSKKQSFQLEEVAPTDDIMQDLMKNIENAINDWAVRYGLEDVPKNIIFEQALTVMNAWYKEMRKGNDG